MSPKPATVAKEPLATAIFLLLGLGRYGKVEIWRSYGLWYRSLLSKSHHKPYVRHLCKKIVKVHLEEPKNKFHLVCQGIPTSFSPSPFLHYWTSSSWFVKNMWIKKIKLRRPEKWWWRSKWCPGLKNLQLWYHDTKYGMKNNKFYLLDSLYTQFI